MFMPRDDHRIWVANSALSNASVVRTMTLRHIDPVIDERTRAYVFPNVAASETEVVDDDDASVAPFQTIFSGPQVVCLSAGTPGSRASQCGSAKDTAAFTTARSAASDNPDETDVRDPGPTPSGSGGICSGGGVPWPEATRCTYFLDENDCCYADFESACLATGCPYDSCREGRHSETQLKSVTCGTAVDP
jgi:hypothetical protein